MIGVVVPAHDEEEHIGACVRSLLAASRCAGLDGEAVTAVVVADACRDATAEIATRAGAIVVRWLAFTDADSVVAPDWISAQLALGSDAVCGTIAVADWGSYGERMKRHFEATYTDADGHPGRCTQLLFSQRLRRGSCGYDTALRAFTSLRDMSLRRKVAEALRACRADSPAAARSSYSISGFAEGSCGYDTALWAFTSLRDMSLRRKVEGALRARVPYRPAAARSASTLSVLSQVKSGSSRPKWP